VGREQRNAAGAGIFPAGEFGDCAIDECPVLSPRLAHTFAQLQEMARSGRLPEAIQEIEAFADSADEKIALKRGVREIPKACARVGVPLSGKLCRRSKVCCC